MRLAYYAGASTAAAAACLLKAFHQRPNFYSATVYLSQSNACLLILTNLVLVLACSFMFALQRLLYGPLRPIEIEQLSEKAWYAVLDTLLAMPSFREDVGGWLLTMFVLLLAGKVWGWIGEGRVDILEQQPPANPRLFHARLSTSLIVSVIFDALMLNYCVETVIADPRPGMMVIFTFEFAILSIFSIFTLARYMLSLAETSIVKKQTKLAIETRKSEIQAERVAARQSQGDTPAAAPADEEPIEVDENEVDVPGWEEKRRYLFALEVLTDFVKLMIYIIFFTVSITFNGLPMHIMRDVYMTFASFSKRVSDYVAYRKATSDMNSRYPDATTEEIRGDACIVCRESMVAWEQPNAGGDAQPAGEQGAAAPAPARRRDEGLRAKKLPCGHILHLRCLKAWLERQQACPTCRRPVITTNAPQNGAAAPGGNPPAQGQQGQQQPRPPRARMFNLGPLRVGFLNAPANQMQNVINQIQNPNGAANQNQQDANQQGAPQQGPNHLGLQVPYANGAGVAQTGPAATSRGLTGLRAAVPLDLQLLQLEQRIMQEAHNLNLDQQRLANLRVMEAEVARLRSQRLPAQQAVGMNGAQRQMPPPQAAFPHIPMYGQMPAMMPMFQGFPPPSPPPGPLTGNSAQQLDSSSQSLPEGLVLPEGWTLMPLQRVQGTQPQTFDPSQGQQVENGPQAVDTTVAADPVTAVVESAGVNGQPTQNGTSNTGPTDDNGSPLFVPTTTNNVAESQTAAAPAGPISQQSEPPAAASSWGFNEQPAASSQQPQEDSSSHPAANGSYTGKGKAKAVEVEDAPDPEA
ncbi:hypothetical protein M409DRAFT_66752 [Zasmidium cellare ATCC 36951]|uniref:RING-type E3 ubiquitin transferase n=1 Tax=Zasmidium cellare ATCC 36951 TaxID=1080233 RepID=A0A6A6CLH6_ZASCE|nr:uncharacterized protein M409DRAFT_66752 [Zasmidium cellare ATCC 36951]KAF2166286.1 hypothetical protein M409DRAFT_66752 [Zasmidium cellare ATCC 36951]